MTVKEIRKITKLTQRKFCEKYNIPLSTLRQWEQEQRKPPGYVLELLEFKVRKDIPLEVIRERDNIGNIFRCPHCRHGFFDDMAYKSHWKYLIVDGYKYCPVCGGKIQWWNVIREMEESE